MSRNITLAFWAGGGVWGQSQLIHAGYINQNLDQGLSGLIDIHAAGSIGNIAGLVTALDKPYEKAQESFKKCAETMMGGSLRSEQLSRSVQHSLHHLNKGVLKRRLFKDQTDKIHLNHNELRRFLNSSFARTKLNNLKTSFVSFAHHMETNERAGFVHIAQENVFNMDRWAVVPNHGSDHSVIDIAMASTAAPTVFGPHQIGQNHYIDCANLCSPLSVVKNIFRMAVNPKETTVDVLYFGTGYETNDRWDAEAYRNHGILQMLSNWTTSTGLASVKQDLRELEADYGDRVSLIPIDVPIPIEFEGKSFCRESFNGSTEYFRSIEKIASKNLEIKGEEYIAAIEKIAERKANALCIDPLIASHLPQQASTEQVKPLVQPCRSNSRKPFEFFGRLRAMRPLMSHRIHGNTGSDQTLPPAPPLPQLIPAGK